MKTRSLTYFLGVLNIVVTTVLIVFAANLLFSGALGDEASRVLRVKYLEPILRKVDVSYIFFDLVQSDMPIYEVYIDPKDYENILALREKKLKDRDFDFPYFKARFLNNGITYNVKIKLRGLLPNHWMGEKKSWKIKFKKENYFNGQRVLNLVIPSDRDYVKEHLAYFTARKLGVLTPDSKFVILKINGQNQGVYFQVEQFGKEFLAHHLRAENSDIYDGEDSALKDNIFKDLGYWSKVRSEKVSGFENYANVYKLLDILNDPDDERFYGLVNQLVDVEKMLAWNANSALYFDYHQDNRHNVRFVFDPVTGRFEPLVWDCSHPVFVEDVDKAYNDLITRLLKKPEYLLRRNQILWGYVSDPENLKQDLEYFDKTYKEIKGPILADPKKDISNIRFIYVMRSIRKDIAGYYAHLAKKLSESWAHAAVLFKGAEGQNIFTALLEIKTGGFSPVKLTNVKVVTGTEGCVFSLYADTDNDGCLSGNDTLIKTARQTGPGTYETGALDKILFPSREVVDGVLKPQGGSFRFIIVSSAYNAPLTGYPEVVPDVLNAVTGGEAKTVVKYVDTKPYDYLDDTFLTTEEFLIKYPFVKPGIDGTLAIESGENVITGTVVVPPGISITIKPGAVLKFAPGASFVSYGRITARGEKSSPIILEPLDKSQSWGVFAVVNEKADGSVFSNVRVMGGSEAFINGMYFTGALAAHNADITLEDCYFEDNKGDDAANIKNDIGQVKRCIFKNNKFDGLDYDFVRDGLVEDCVFEGNGNDGIDLGTANPVIVNCAISASGDKGISCGEASKPVIFNSRITGCNIGIALKDSAEAIIINCELTGNKTGIASYRKKPWWAAPGKAKIYNSILRNDRDLDISEKNSVEARYTFISDPALQDKDKSVWTGAMPDEKALEGMPVDEGIVKEYFPDTDRQKLRLGAF